MRSNSPDSAIITAAVMSVKRFENNRGGPGKLLTASIIPMAVWESEDIAAADADLATLTAEIEQFEQELLAGQPVQTVVTARER